MINLEELFLAQAKLDEEIANNHHISYKTTRARRILALLVELGEFANSTRCFKYWSNKPSESKERVLDEYADGLHFFLSLGIDIKTDKKVYNKTRHEKDLTSQIVKTYQLVSKFSIRQDDKSYIKAFQSFINISTLLGVRWSTIEKAYFNKLDENYNRQKTNY